MQCFDAKITRFGFKTAAASSDKQTTLAADTCTTWWGLRHSSSVHLFVAVAITGVPIQLNSFYLLERRHQCSRSDEATSVMHASLVFMHKTGRRRHKLCSTVVRDVAIVVNAKAAPISFQNMSFEVLLQTIWIKARTEIIQLSKCYCLLMSYSR